ncbi:sugar fermentation stimulation protein [Achlya hypogyna]|uniref:Sugar fermentation stimulation protein n=1 Tax=Achlya hypogyna TaxID=1202772 RepID=A0A1V9YTC4_ACHHY|nr:sugar fermentation stimulation protein [Achlya hypogyna]
MVATRRTLRSSSTTAQVVEDAVVPAKRAKRVKRTAKPLKSVDVDLPRPRSADPAGRVVAAYPRLVQGQLLKRYKRFLADVQLANDEVVTVHCPNTGPMIGLLDLPLAPVQLSISDNPKRKYAHTLEHIQVENGSALEWVGVHSTSANGMVGTALRNGWLPEVVENRTITKIQAEVKHTQHSRIDFVVETEGPKTFYIEVKSVTLAMPGQKAVFPDTVSTRAQKHIEELISFQSKQSSKDIQSTVLFLIQRRDCESFAPSVAHDAAFAKLCAEAHGAGVAFFAYDCELVAQDDQGHVLLKGSVPVVFDSEAKS